MCPDTDTILAAPAASWLGKIGVALVLIARGPGPGPGPLPPAAPWLWKIHRHEEA